MTVDRWTEHETIAKYHVLEAERDLENPAVSAGHAQAHATIALTHMLLAVCHRSDVVSAPRVVIDGGQGAA